MTSVAPLSGTSSGGRPPVDGHEQKLVGEAGIPAGAVLDTDELNKDVTSSSAGSCRR